MCLQIDVSILLGLGKRKCVLMYGLIFVLILYQHISNYMVVNYGKNI